MSTQPRLDRQPLVPGARQQVNMNFRHAKPHRWSPLLMAGSNPLRELLALADIEDGDAAIALAAADM